MATNTYTIRRRIEIDSAHRVPDHRSKCYAIHGHRYIIEAYLSGGLFDEGEQKGMVMDFGFVKHVMMETIHNPCDHGLILCKNDAILDTIDPDPSKRPRWLKLYLIDDVPTAENLARHWYYVLRKGINHWMSLRPDASSPVVVPPELTRIAVYETPNCVAYYPHLD